MRGINEPAAAGHHPASHEREVFRMMDMLKKAVLASIGAVSLTHKKVEEVVGELVKRGELTEDQGRKIVQNLVDEGEKQKDDIARRVSEAVAEALSKMDVARKSELAALERRVEKLEQSK